MVMTQSRHDCGWESPGQRGGESNWRKWDPDIERSGHWVVICVFKSPRICAERDNVSQVPKSLETDGGNKWIQEGG